MARAASSRGAEADPSPTISIENMTNLAMLFVAFKELMPDATETTIATLARDQLDRNEKRSRPMDKIVGSENVIPRDVSKQLDNITKLEFDNFHTWRLDLETALESIPSAHGMIFGDVDADHPDYNKILDIRLAGIIRSICDMDGSKNVRYILDSKTKWSGGRELFASIQFELSKLNKIQAAQCLGDMSRVRLINNDIEKAIFQVRDIKNRGRQLGVDFPPQHMVQTLLNCSGYSNAYKDIWVQLETMGQTTDFDTVAAALLTKWRRLQNEPHHREPRAAALNAKENVKENGKENGKNNANSASLPAKPRLLTPEEAYLIGKRDPNNPDEPAKCYNCGRPGHIAINCPERRRLTLPAKTSVTASAKVANQENTPPAQVQESTALATEGRLPSK